MYGKGRYTREENIIHEKRAKVYVMYKEKEGTTRNKEKEIIRQRRRE